MTGVCLQRRDGGDDFVIRCQKGEMTLLRNDVAIVIFVDYVNGFVGFGGCAGSLTSSTGTKTVETMTASLTSST